MSISTILGVFVLYEDKFELTKTFKSILQGLNNKSDQFEILLYDNSIHPHYDVKYFEIKNFKVHYTRHSSNPGIGKAYNTGVALAQKSHQILNERVE